MKGMDKSGGGCGGKEGLYNLDELNSEAFLIIQLPDSPRNVWRLVLFVFVVVLVLPLLGSMIRASYKGPRYESYTTDLGAQDAFKILPVLIRDLKDEGLVKKGEKGFVMGPDVWDIKDDLEFLRDGGVDLMTEGSLKEEKVEERRVFDFAFAPSVRGTHLIDGILKDGGLMIAPLGNDPSDELRLLRSFKIVYLRRFQSTVVGMRKIVESSNGIVYSNAPQVSCSATPEKKRVALKGLEDVYLEPPRQTSLARGSSSKQRKIKFLPDLLKDSLDGYQRRIFISDDSNALNWFYKNYPTRDQEFEAYNLEIGINMGKTSKPRGTSASSWIMKNLRREDYVVMKAEAQMVEEMLQDKALCLIDELFMECKNQWEDGGEKRAYWECLALYGKVRDEGIAVHQWWN